MSDEIRERLITARIDAGMTQRDLAAALEVSQPFVAACESGTKVWPEERVEEVLEAILVFLEERAKSRAKMRAVVDKLYPFTEEDARRLEREREERERPYREQAEARSRNLALKPCRHPARKGRHEWYVHEDGEVCRACGAIRKGAE